MTNAKILRTVILVAVVLVIATLFYPPWTEERMSYRAPFERTLGYSFLAAGLLLALFKPEQPD